MPSTADQLRQSSAIANPFDDAPPKLSSYTAQEIATLQSRLNKQLGPEYISKRDGPGGKKVAYVTAEKVINLANEVFGFNGWSSAIQTVQIDFVDGNKEGKVSLGLSVIMRVSLRDGTFHEDIGYGSIENAKNKAAAFEKAKKEAATDALKRALRTFGNLLGNCLYDKEYLDKVGKMKVQPTKWDVDRLHRHPDFAPKVEVPAKLEAPVEQKPMEGKGALMRRNTTNGSTEFEDDFGGSLFDGVEMSEAHGDEVTMQEGDTSIVPRTGNQTPQNMPPPPNRQHMQRMQSMPSLRDSNNIVAIQNQQQGEDRFEAQKQQARMAAMARRAVQQNGNGDIAASNAEPAQQLGPPPTKPHAPAQRQPQTMQDPTTARSAAPATEHTNAQAQAAASKSNPSSANETARPSEATNGHQRGAPEAPQAGVIPTNLPVAFVSSRAANLLQNPPTTDASKPLPIFNPHAESPSLRRTSGFNHSRSGPISREQLGKPVEPAIDPSKGVYIPPLRGAGGGNFIDPRMDPNRRVGMPGQAQSPLANRGAYKPPGPAHGIKRPPLADVSNVAGAEVGVAPAGDGADAKKLKVAPS